MEDLGHRRAIVVGIAPVPGLATRDQRSAAGSKVDAVIAGDVAVLLEFKITGQCERAQLIRHAQHWALEISDTDAGWSGGPCDGFAFSSWSAVGDWIATELASPDLPARERTRLMDLSTILQGPPLGLVISPTAGAPIAAARPVAVEDPPRTPLRDMTAGVDLDAVYRECMRLYGKRGTKAVSATGCEADVAYTQELFRAARQPIPPGLVGNAMTNRRVLTSLYSAEGKTNATPNGMDGPAHPGPGSRRRCWEGMVFFSFVIDVYSRRIVGWQFASHMRTDCGGS